MNDRTNTARGLGQVEPQRATPSTPRPPAPSSPELGEAERTSTLRGLGFTSYTLRGVGERSRPAPGTSCPCCRVKIDEVSADLSACMGLAVAMVQGAEAAKATLCTMHRRLFRLLVDAMKSGPKGVGGAASWDDFPNAGKPGRARGGAPPPPGARGASSGAAASPSA